MKSFRNNVSAIIFASVAVLAGLGAYGAITLPTLVLSVILLALAGTIAIAITGASRPPQTVASMLHDEQPRR